MVLADSHTPHLKARAGAIEPMVEFVGVDKTYDGKALVVQDMNLTVRRGEFLTMLGPSGSGKTTALMMLAGFEKPTRGSILLNGASIERHPPHRRGIGVVFQNYALFPNMTVAENLAFPLQVRKRPKTEIERQIAKALELVRLGSFGSRRPTALSGGQQQRIALARALVFEPQLVLMDEPLGALDRQLREHMQFEIKQIHRDLGITIVYVTHDQGEAMTMSDRVAVFHEGRIQQLSTPIDLYEKPASAFVAQFIGENNAFKGTVDAIDGRYCRVRVSDSSLTSTSVDLDIAGSECVLSIRPERINLDQRDESCPNRLSARVTDIIHLGDHVRVCLSAFGDQTLVAKVPANHPAVNLQHGQPLLVGFRPEDCRAFPAS